MSNMLPLDARIRELWKAVAITASESKVPETAIERADAITLAFIDRFYPNAIEAGGIRSRINTAMRKS